MAGILGGVPQTYLVDFACYRPPEELRVVAEEIAEAGKCWKMYKQDNVDFMYKVFAKSGLSATGTFLPSNIHPCHTKEPSNDIPSALREAEMVMTGAVSELLEKMHMKPTDINILVTCTSVFCSTPSLASMLVNRFKMRPDIQSYHLGGMGCGTGVVAVNLMRDLLAARPNSVALFVPAEITSYCFYDGEEKSRMVANMIFRMGGAAIMFSNKPSLRRVAKYQLMHAVRTHHGAGSESYGCMSWGPDKNGVNGVFLGKNVVSCAGSAIEDVVTQVVPKILSWRNYGEAAVHHLRRSLGADLPDYLPDFGTLVDHYIIHAGGYAVLKAIRDRLNIPSSMMIPSFATLHAYGNTSCSTTWYALGFAETTQGIRRGETVLQLGVGGGVKAGCNVWRALRDIDSDCASHKAWAHLSGKAFTEADMARGIDDGEIRDAKLREIAESIVQQQEQRQREMAAANVRADVVAP